MERDLRLQRLFDRVDLVSGIGTPDLGQMCVMSFVAALAGEGHTDCPRTASPVVRALAIPLNDAMPRALRQRLKPFAPRILGTRDGHDAERAAVLRHALVEDILPRHADHAAAAGRGLAGRLWSRLCRRALRRRLGVLLARAEARGGGDDAALLAGAAGRFIGLSARSARDAGEAGWYWNQGVALLDRLCDVGAAERSVPVLTPERLARLESVLARGPALPRLPASGAGG